MSVWLWEKRKQKNRAKSVRAQRKLSRPSIEFSGALMCVSVKVEKEKKQQHCH